MKIKKTLLVLFPLLMGLGYTGWRWLAQVPEARAFSLPAVTEWKPEGLRTASLQPRPAAIPRPDGFHTMHASTANSDEIWSAVAPAFELDWVAETELYVPEGPTYDNAGNLYFSPSNPREDVSLVSLDRQTGKRRWAIPGKGPGCGAPLVLDDPEHPGTQLIYHSTYTEAMALRADGSTVWRVPTGLVAPPVLQGQRSQTHVWGMNYLPQADALVAVTMDGWVYVHDRKSGAPLLAQPFQLPGVVPTVSHTRRVPDWLVRRADAETTAVFGETGDGLGLFTSVLDVIYGNGVRVANFFAIDPNSGSLFIAATAPDEQDGKLDGHADNGALYRLELVAGESGGRELKVADRYYFEGGTGSTPTVSEDGAWVVVSDDNGNVIALDAQLKERWRVNVGDQVAASIAVSANNSEMYAVTASDIVKLHNDGDSARIVWRATLDAFPGYTNFNALTPTIAANGIVVSVAGGRRVGRTQIASAYGMGLLDRETGRLRWFSVGREESIAVTSVGPDGEIYIGSSPIRRAVARGLFGDRLPPLVGGIQHYRPVHRELLARDAICAAAALARRREATPDRTPAESASRRDDLAQISLLAAQARRALPAARAAGDLDDAALQAHTARLAALPDDLSSGAVDGLAVTLDQACSALSATVR